MKRLLPPWWPVVLFALACQLPFAAPAAAQADTCQVGQELEPDESCSIPAGPGRTYTFEVKDDGEGCVTGAGIPETCREMEFNDPLFREFAASRIEGTNRWRIDSMPGVPAPALPLAGLAVLALLLWRAGSRRVRRLT